MSSKEEIKHYIRRTKFKNPEKTLLYTIYTDELSVLIDMIQEGCIFEALVLCFEFGRAKGFRMAKSNH